MLVSLCTHQSVQAQHPSPLLRLRTVLHHEGNAVHLRHYTFHLAYLYYIVVQRPNTVSGNCPSRWLGR